MQVKGDLLKLSRLIELNGKIFLLWRLIVRIFYGRIVKRSFIGASMGLIGAYKIFDWAKRHF